MRFIPNAGETAFTMNGIIILVVCVNLVSKS